MKCSVCGNESGKFPLCRFCNEKKNRGEIIKCNLCQNWHYAHLPCPNFNDPNFYLYNLKPRLVSKAEQQYYDVICSSVPNGCHVFPQVNLAAFITKADASRFQNELFRNVDFLVVDVNFYPVFIIEINDQTHLTPERKERDEKVLKICEEAGIPILRLWTSYGVNPEYIKKRISEILESLPVQRVHHFSQSQVPINNAVPQPPASSPPPKKGACYIASCVYGSYDAPQVWVLRRYRDYTLSSNLFGRFFIRAYYFISPKIVRIFGTSVLFQRTFKSILDKFVHHLESKGFSRMPYNDL